MYDKPAAPLMPINHRNMISADLKAFGNKVGVYSNHATIFEAMRGLFSLPEHQRQIDEINLRKQLLREIIGAEIDSTKGLEKPKEPMRFTKKLKYDADASPEEKAEVYYHNSLVISKKPYFFRYLYPELNQTYKRYEASYNELSKSMFRTKFKKLLVKATKNDAEKSFIKKYHKFSPLINTNCTMNIMCRKFEGMDFDIKYNKDCESKLPFKDLSTFSVDETILGRFRRMYQRYCNKKSLSYINYVYDGCGDDDYKEIRFGAMDAVRNELQDELAEMGLSTLDALTYIKVLSISYAKFNWGFAWDLLEEAVLDVIEDGDALAPVEDDSGEEYLGRRYSLKHIPKEEKSYNIDEDTGEVTFVCDGTNPQVLEVHIEE